MQTKETSRVDGQGRIVIPANVRKQIGLKTGCIVTITVDDETTFRVEAMSVRRCSICSESVEASNRIPITVGRGEKYVCPNCVKSIAKALKEAK